MNRHQLLLSITSAVFAISVAAETCEITTTRTACPGKESLSYKKCHGKASCSEFIEVKNANECKVASVSACENARLNITKLKVVNASFNGSELKTDAGSSDFCTIYEKRDAEFNQC